MTHLLIAIIYLCFIALGLPDSLIASAWPIMHDSIDASLATAGVLSTIIAFMTILSSLSFGHLIKRFNTQTITFISILMTASALIGYGNASTLPQFILWSIPYGLGAGCIDASLNNYVSLHFSTKHMSWLHAFWGVGATLSPMAMNLAITSSNSWRLGFMSVALIQLIIAFLVFTSRKRWIQTKSIHNSVNTNSSGTLQNHHFKYSLFSFFAYCALEATLGLWITSYFFEYKGFSYALAANATSLYYAGIMVGRFLTGFITKKLTSFKIIQTGLMLVLTGLLVLILQPQSELLNIISVVLVGLGSAPIYPMLLHQTPLLFGEERASILIGYQMASAYLSITIAPLIFGYIFEYVSGVSFGFYNLIFLLILIGCTQHLTHLHLKHVGSTQ